MITDAPVEGWADEYDWPEPFPAAALPFDADR